MRGSVDYEFVLESVPSNSIFFVVPEIDFGNPGERDWIEIDFSEKIYVGVIDMENRWEAVPLLVYWFLDHITFRSFNTPTSLSRIDLP